LFYLCAAVDLVVTGAAGEPLVVSAVRRANHARAPIEAITGKTTSRLAPARNALRRSRELAHSRLLEVVHFAVQDREHDRQRKQPPTASPSSFASPRQHRRKQQRPRR